MTVRLKSFKMCESSTIQSLKVGDQIQKGDLVFKHEGERARFFIIVEDCDCVSMIRFHKDQIKFAIIFSEYRFFEVRAISKAKKNEV